MMSGRASRAFCGRCHELRPSMLCQTVVKQSTKREGYEIIEKQ